MSKETSDRLKLVSSRPSDENAERASSYELDWSILMARAQAGDAAAYLRLLQDITPYLRSLAARYHRDPRDIEDTVQDILLTLHAIRATYDPARPFGPWLVGIAYRRAIDRLRRQGRIHLEGAIGDLPPAQQQAIHMLKLKEMSLKEAARESGRPISALKVATHRALKSLRRMLLDHGDP